MKDIMMINGHTRIIAHIGFPTEAFKAPMIYNPWFEMKGINTVVMPMGVEAAAYPEVMRSLFRIKNVDGALITMPHKVTTTGLMDELSVTAKVAGACNAILRRPDGSLLGDMFDGAGFVRGMARKGRTAAGARALVVGSGGVGSAIAASLAAERPALIALYDGYHASAEALAGRLREHYPALEISTGSNDPHGFDIVVNATPMGMRDGDELPFDIERASRETFIGEVVMREEFTPLLKRAMEKGCQVQVGTDMLYEQIPAYLEFFGYGSTTPEELRGVSKLQY
jgi:shikimate dehydrogenase